MGTKQCGTGKRIYLYLASFLTGVAALGGCAAVRDIEQTYSAKQSLHASETLLKQQLFEQSLRQAEEARALAGSNPPADEALFTRGLIYAHPDNPDKDYQEAITSFEELFTEFPRSHLADQAKTWSVVLQELEAAEEKEADSAVTPLAKRKTRRYKKDQQASPADEHLRRGQQFLQEKNFDNAIKEYQEALALASHGGAAEHALYNLGLIFAHSDNPDKDYKIALEFFTMLTDKFPQSALIEQARVWVDLLKTIEGAKQVDIEIEEKKKELLTR